MTSEQYECVIADLTKQVNERDARIAELEAALKDLLDDWRYMTGIEEADEEDNSAVRAAAAALKETGDE